MLEKQILLEDELKTKREKLAKTKKSLPKIALLLTSITFVLPYIPSRHGTILVEKYGYWGGVLFASVITFLICPVIIYYQISKSEDEINEIERNLELEKRLTNLNK
jgi:hypothetical protein